jgi:hypothetical protein
MSKACNLMVPLRLVLFASLWMALSSTAAAQGRADPYLDLSKEPPLQLELGLKMYKNTYLLREPIRVRVSVTNVGEHAGKFHFITGDALVITDSKGAILPCNMQIFRTGITQIQPGQTMEDEVNLSSYAYGVPHTELKAFWYLPPDTYTISYRLHQTHVSGGSLFAESAVDTFEVVEPHGDDSLALELLLQSYDLQIEKKYDRARETLDELLEKYPESGYVPYVRLKTATTLEEWREIITRFPESGEAIDAVSSIAYHFTIEKDRAAYIQAMNELINQYPDTDIARAASRLKDRSDRFFRERPKRRREHRQEGE